MRSGPGVQLGLGDPQRLHRVTGQDQGIQLRLDGFPVDAVLHVEIQPAALRADGSAGDAVAQNGAEQVQTGMHAHMGVAARPVQRQSHMLAGLRRHGAGLEHMHDAIALAVTGIDDGGGAAVGPVQHAGIARLSAADRIEHRSVDLHHALAGGT